MSAATNNALHAAEVWLARINADPAAVAVVNINPAAVGVWRVGAENIGMLATIDDAGAKLCEALAPATHEAMEQLSDIQQ